MPLGGTEHLSIRVLAEDRLDCAVFAIGWYYRDIPPLPKHLCRQGLPGQLVRHIIQGTGPWEDTVSVVTIQTMPHPPVLGICLRMANLSTRKGTLWGGISAPYPCGFGCGYQIGIRMRICRSLVPVQAGFIALFAQPLQVQLSTVQGSVKSTIYIQGTFGTSMYKASLMKFTFPGHLYFWDIVTNDRMFTGRHRSLLSIFS